MSGDIWINAGDGERIDMGWMFFFFPADLGNIEVLILSQFCQNLSTSEEGLVPLSPQHPEELVEQVPFGLRRLG